MSVNTETISDESHKPFLGILQNCEVLFLIMISALLLASAFFLPAMFAWCVFIFLIPLYYCGFKYDSIISFKHGIWWGIFFIGIHFSGVAFFFWKECSQCKFLPGLLIISYFTLHAGFWFGITRILVRIKPQSDVWKSAGWAITTFCFFYWYKYYSMWFFGIYTNGYCFGSPLLPLAHYPQTLKALYSIGESGLIFLLILMQEGIAFGIYKNNKLYFLSTLLLAPFFWGYVFLHDIKEIPAYVHLLAYVQIPSKIHSYEQAMALDFQIDALTHQNPAIKYIVMPETSFNKSINMSADLMSLMTLNSHSKNINIFVGAHRRYKDKVFNSLYWIKKGHIESYYDKKIRMPFSEFVPFPWDQSTFLKEMFLKNWDGYAAQEMLNTGFVVDKELSFIPCICSDFYFDSIERFYNYDQSYPILLIVGELWASQDYLKRLMQLYAVYHALLLKKDIIYVGYTVGCWIDKNSGRYFPLFS